MKTRIAIFYFLFVFVGQSHAQDYQHFTSWNRIGVAKVFNPNWELWVEGFLRQQSNFHVDKNNPFTSPLMRAGRIFVFYKKNHTVLGISPMMYIHSHQLLGKEADFSVKSNQEYRSNVFVEQWKDFGKINLRLRLSYELRYLQNLNYVPIGRFRPRLTAKYPITKKLWVIAYEDLMLNTVPNTQASVFNINQAYLGFNRRLSKNIDVEIGYFNNFRKRNSLVEFDNENALNLMLQVKF